MFAEIILVGTDEMSSLYEFRKHENQNFRNSVYVSNPHSLSITLQFPIFQHVPFVTSSGKGPLCDRFFAFEAPGMCVFHSFITIS